MLRSLLFVCIVGSFGCSRGPLRSDVGEVRGAAGADASVPDASVGDLPACLPNEYRRLAVDGPGTCVAVSSCGSGEYEQRPPTKTSDRACAPVTQC